MGLKAVVNSPVLGIMMGVIIMLIVMLIVIVMMTLPVMTVVTWKDANG